MRHDAGEIARLLAASIDRLARELLPAGRCQGAEWVAPSLHGGSRRSLSVRLTGAKAGVWSDFAGDARGDALDLVAHVCTGGNRGEALRWARGWLGLSDAPGGSSAPPAPPPPPPRGEPDADEAARRNAALRLFLAAEPALRGTPVAAYLAGRGIDLAELVRQPGALRFHPACWCSEAKANLPAMLAAIVRPGAGHVATHRTFLAKDAEGVWRKAPLRYPKTTLGSFAGGFITLWRGASGRQLGKAAEGETVAIAEGIETGLSVAIACPQYRVLAAVSIGNLGRMVLPPVLNDLIICGDNDLPGSPAALALRKAIDRLLTEGRSVRVARSPVGKDFNDALIGAAA
jgi:hypothetical protein